MDDIESNGGTDSPTDAWANMPTPPTQMTIVGWPKSATYAIAFMLVAILCLSMSNVWTAAVARRIEESAECRFDRNVEISIVNDRIDLWTARGLAATVRNDRQGVQTALIQIDSLSNEFEQLVSSRQDVIEICD